VNGQKVWTSYADVADWCFLLCRTEPEAPKHHGISLLLVDMRSPGISVRPLMQITGDAEFSEVFFEDVRVPAEMMVGAPGAGWQIAIGILAHERGPVWTFTFQRTIRRSLERLLGAARAHPAARRAPPPPGDRPPRAPRPRGGRGGRPRGPPGAAPPLAARGAGGGGSG